MSEDDEELQKEIMAAEMAKRKAAFKLQELKALAEAKRLKKESEEKIQRLEQSRGAERPEPSTSSASPAPINTARDIISKFTKKEKLKEMADLLSGMGWIFIIVGIALLALKFLYGFETIFTYFQLFAIGIIFLIGGTFLEAIFNPKPKRPEKNRRRQEHE